jgi:hypothetical protein
VSSPTAELPGQQLVDAGVADLAAGRRTEAALVTAMAAPRLRALGIDVPAYAGDVPGHALYALLAESPGAHSRYNALIAQMVSFARAAEHASTR